MDDWLKNWLQCGEPPRVLELRVFSQHMSNMSRLTPRSHSKPSVSQPPVLRYWYPLKLIFVGPHCRLHRPVTDTKIDFSPRTAFRAVPKAQCGGPEVKPLGVYGHHIRLPQTLACVFSFGGVCSVLGTPCRNRSPVRLVTAGSTIFNNLASANATLLRNVSQALLMRHALIARV